MKELLVVDDSKTQRLAVKIQLQGGDYSITEAGDGAEALELLKSRTFDLILTDLTMPDVDGFTLIEHARKMATVDRVPIVVMTTRGAEEDVERAIDLGATAYIIKPVKKSDLLQVLERQLKV